MKDPTNNHTRKEINSSPSQILVSNNAMDNGYRKTGDYRHSISKDRPNLELHKTPLNLVAIWKR
jgi:hypothetical protein